MERNPHQEHNKSGHSCTHVDTKNQRKMEREDEKGSIKMRAITCHRPNR